MGVFNPTPKHIRSYPTMKVHSNNLAVTRMVNETITHLNFTLVKNNHELDSTKSGEYELTIEVDLKPFELCYINVTEKGEVGQINATHDEEMSLSLKKEFILKSGGNSMTIRYNLETNQTENVTLSTPNTTLTLNESLISYNGVTTHSCVYLFNPILPMQDPL